MKHIAKLLKATPQDRIRPEYKEGLQAMWEDRWSLLGHAGAALHLLRHGAFPEIQCPLIPVPIWVRGVRRIIPNQRETDLGRTFRAIRAAL